MDHAFDLKLDFNPACIWCKQKDDGFEYPVTIMDVGGVSTMVTLAEAQNADPAAPTIHFIKGFKSHPAFYKILLDDLTEAGINVVLVTLPDPGHDVDFMDHYEDLVEAVILDGVLDPLTSSHGPRIAAGHSTGAFLIAKILQDSEADAKQFGTRYEGAYLASPFFGNRFTRWPLGRLLTRMLEKFAGVEAHVGSTWIEQALRKEELEDEPDIGDKEIKMFANYRQSRYMAGPTSDFMKKLGQEGFNKTAKALNIVFALGKHDQIGMNKLSKQVAKALKAKVRNHDGGHSFIRKTKEGRKGLVKYVQKIQAAHIKHQPANDRGIDSPDPELLA